MKMMKIVAVVMRRTSASIIETAVTEMMRRTGTTRTGIAKGVDDTETTKTMIPGRGTRITTITTTIDPIETATRPLKSKAKG